ncbi:MAG: hypothetical protein ACKVVP_05000, partial [Chloroflexota bacterium]
MSRLVPTFWVGARATASRPSGIRTLSHRQSFRVASPQSSPGEGKRKRALIQQIVDLIQQGHGGKGLDKVVIRAQRQG